jgi:peptidoglycan/xylan/chitin deacetylase (PgdA/CDA1 family)
MQGGSVIRIAAGAVSRGLEPVLMMTRRLSRDGLILLYHRISPERDPAYPPLSPAQFEGHCEFVRKHLRAVPLSELVERKKKGLSLKQLCAITFDDGYRDFLTHAHPILKTFGFPHTHFLVADCLEQGRATWNLRLRHLVPDGREMKRIRSELAVLPRAERYRWLEREESARPGGGEPPMLRVPDFAAIDNSLLEWGSHTRSHPMLPLAAPEEVRFELADSKQSLERLTGRPIRYLAYPNGEHNEAVMRAASDCGYEAAFAVGQRSVRAEADLFAIPRFDVSDLPAAMLGSEVAGVTPALRALRRGLRP